MLISATQNQYKVPGNATLAQEEIGYTLVPGGTSGYYGGLVETTSDIVGLFNDSSYSNPLGTLIKDGIQTNWNRDGFGVSSWSFFTNGKIILTSAYGQGSMATSSDGGESWDVFTSTLDSGEQIGVYGNYILDIYFYENKYWARIESIGEYLAYSNDNMRTWIPLIEDTPRAGGVFYKNKYIYPAGNQLKYYPLTTESSEIQAAEQTYYAQTTQQSGASWEITNYNNGIFAKYADSSQTYSWLEDNLFVDNGQYINQFNEDLVNGISKTKNSRSWFAMDSYNRIWFLYKEPTGYALKLCQTIGNFRDQYSSALIHTIDDFNLDSNGDYVYNGGYKPTINNMFILNDKIYIQYYQGYYDGVGDISKIICVSDIEPRTYFNPTITEYQFNYSTMVGQQAEAGVRNYSVIKGTTVIIQQFIQGEIGGQGNGDLVESLEAVDVYTVPSGKQAIISSIVVENLSNNAITYDLAILSANEEFNEENSIHWDKSIIANGQDYVKGIYYMNAGDSITILPSTVNSVNITVSGVEKTL